MLNWHCREKYYEMGEKNNGGKDDRARPIVGKHLGGD